MVVLKVFLENGQIIKLTTSWLTDAEAIKTLLERQGCVVRIEQ